MKTGTRTTTSTSKATYAWDTFLSISVDREDFERGTLENGDALPCAILTRGEDWNPETVKDDIFVMQLRKAALVRYLKVTVGTGDGFFEVTTSPMNAEERAAADERMLKDEQRQKDYQAKKREEKKAVKEQPVKEDKDVQTVIDGPKKKKSRKQGESEVAALSVAG